MRLDHLLSKEEIVRVGLLLSRHSVNGDNRIKRVRMNRREGIRKFDHTKLKLHKFIFAKL